MAEEAKTPLLRDDELFVDNDFPASNVSLFEKPEDSPEYQWKRPKDMDRVTAPQMFVEGASRADVHQGDLGDCWFLSACAAVAQGRHMKTRYDGGPQGAWVLNSSTKNETRKLVDQVIPSGQVLYGEGYTGKVSFRFWRMGHWETVEIDDRLPVNEYGELVYAKCQDSNEFWLPLLEKAYAKFHGKYYHLNGGLLDEGLLDLTGAILKTYDVKPEHFRIMRDQFHCGSVILCGSRVAGETDASIVAGHAYTITGLSSFTLGGNRERLLRVRNPWGREEWTETWSDVDYASWRKLRAALSEQFQTLLQNRPNFNDGEAWMDIQDFVRNFFQVTLATIVPEADGLTTCATIGCWERHVNSGGNQDDMESFATNPQYLLTVINPDDDHGFFGADDDETDGQVRGDTSIVQIQLIQEHDRSRYRSPYEAGLAIYRTTATRKRLRFDELTEDNKIITDPNEVVSDNNSLVRREALQPGYYVIIPFLQQRDLSRGFFIRAHSAQTIKLEELKRSKKWWDPIKKYRCW